MMKFDIFSRKWVKRVIIFLGISLGIWAGMIIILAIHLFRYGDVITAEPSDVIIVLGSGLRRDGRAGDALWRRSLWASRLYQQGYADAIICTGGIGRGQTRSESDACRAILIDEGVPADAIFIEEKSHSTEENARYAQEIMTEQGFQSAILVTDSFHMLRASWIFDQQGIAHTRGTVPRDWVARRFFIQHFAREIIALHWQAFKTFFNLPVSNIPFS
ncbi:MAG: hypothetical protein CUN52_07775 [Phototrophicales bacterium]|nr:MAG: hypothetical protein CUN52_07775 [Phototrophicales bacterium]